MGTIGVNLGDYLIAASRRKHVYGAHDCCTFVADWCIANGWPDPMAEWRAGYADASPAHDGLLLLFVAGMGGAGLPVTLEPVEGDVGVVTVFGQEAGAVFTGKRWALVAPRGLAFVSADPAILVKAWGVGRG